MEINQLTYNEITDGEISEVVNLHNNFHKFDRTIDQWNWEWRGYHPELSVFLVMRDHGKLIATQGMMPIYLNICGQKILSGKTEGALILREYWGRDLMKDFFHHAVSICEEHGMEYIWGFTSAVKAFKRYGLEVSNIMADSTLNLQSGNRYVRAARKRSQVDRMLTRIRDGNWFNFFSFGGKKRYVLRESPYDQTDIDNLCFRIRNNCPDVVHIELDEAYIRWRILENPVIKYKTIYLYEGPDLCGFAIIDTGNKSHIYITDITFIEEDAGRELLKYIILYVRGHGCSSVTYFGNRQNWISQSVFELLDRFGFNETSRPDYSFTLRPLRNMDDKTILNGERWYMSGLWTEGFTI